jgi:hypothetical protein
MLLPEDNAELLAVLGGLARDRPGLDKRAADRAELAVLRLVLRSPLRIAVGADQQPLLLPSLLPRLRAPGRVAVVFTDEEAAQGWMDARKTEGPACAGFAPASGFVGAQQPDTTRWRRWLERARVNLLSVNPAGPLTFSATTVEFASPCSRLVARGAAAPKPDPQGAWLEPSARAEVRARARRLLDQLMRGGSEDESAELRQESEAVNRFGSRLFQSQLFLLPSRGNMTSKLHGSLGAASAGDPCLAADGLLEIGRMAVSALDVGEVDEQQRRELRERLKTTAWMLRHLAEVGYRTREIEQIASASTR